MRAIQPSTRNRTPWNKGKLVGPKAPFKPKDIWTTRLQLQQHHRTRELALLNLGIDSKLRGCDLVTLKCATSRTVKGSLLAPSSNRRRPAGRSSSRSRRSPGRPCTIRQAELGSDVYLFPSRLHGSPHICRRQYARMLRNWVKDAGLDWTEYGTHSIRRTKATLRSSRPARVLSSTW
jgi:hypothetical protein